MEKKSLLLRGIQITGSTVLSLTPIFFLPLTQNFYDLNKWMLLCLGTLIILFMWTLNILKPNTPLQIKIPSSAIGFIALTIASIISVAVVSSNKIEALLTPLGPVLFLSLTILVIAGATIPSQSKRNIKWSLYVIVGLLGLISIYQFLGMGKLMFPDIPYLADPLWTPSGSVATTIALFCITLSLLIPDTLASIKKHQEQSVVALLIISLIIIAAGAAVTIWQFVPKIPGSMLPFDIGMVATSKIFSTPLTSAVGIGVENFITAFEAVRPANFNTTPLVSYAFGSNVDFLLHVLTVYGILGLAAAIILIINLLNENKHEGLFIAKLLGIAALLLIPPSVSLLAAIAVLFILGYEEKQAPKQHMGKPWVRTSIGTIFMLTIGVSFYFFIRAYAAEVVFFQSLLAADANNGTKTYNLQIQAININAFLSRYHISYSQTNLSLANSLASQKNAQDQQLVSQLIQQAVREARLAVSLNTNSVSAWENLGLTYQNIIPVASDAADWALSAYDTATKLDPSNPTLFFNVGSIFIAQKKYDNAISLFEQAISLNPSYANAYYNLANAFKLKGDTADETAALSNALKLVQPDSSDYYKVKNELDALQQTPGTPTKQPAQATGSSSLTLP